MRLKENKNKTKNIFYFEYDDIKPIYEYRRVELI